MNLEYSGALGDGETLRYFKQVNQNPGAMTRSHREIRQHNAINFAAWSPHATWWCFKGSGNPGSKLPFHPGVGRMNIRNSPLF